MRVGRSERGVATRRRCVPSWTPVHQAVAVAARMEQPRVDALSVSISNDDDDDDDDDDCNNGNNNNHHTHNNNDGDNEDDDDDDNIVTLLLLIIM